MGYFAYSQSARTSIRHSGSREKYLSSMTAYRKVTSVAEVIKGYSSYHLSLAHLALMPPDLGLQAQSITYWMSLWDKCCKMRYGNRNTLSGSEKTAQNHVATFFSFSKSNASVGLVPI